MFRRVLIWGVVLGLTVGVAGFAAEETELNLAGWFTIQVSNLEQEVGRRFATFFRPDVNIELMPVPSSEYTTKIEVMIAGGNPPDIFWWDGFLAGPLMSKEVLLPLNDIMAETGTDSEEFLPNLLEAFTYDGKIYGIPKDFNTLGLFYNKGVFDEAGVAYPTADWTWEDLRAACEELKAAGFDPLTTILDAARWMPFVFQSGGNFFNEDRTEVVVNSPEAVEAVEFLGGLKADGLVAQPSELGAGWVGGAFGKEDAAMAISGGWLITFMQENFPEVDFGVAQLPMGPAGRGNYIFTVAYVIPKSTKHPEEAWQFVEYLTSLETQLFVLRTGRALPSREALVDSSLLQGNPELLTIFKGAGEGAHPYEFGSLGSTAEVELKAAMEAVWLGTMSAEEALDDAAAALNAELAD